MTNPFQKPKELVLGAVVMMLTITFCFLSTPWGKSVIGPEIFERIFIFVLGAYAGGKFALTKGN